MERKEFCIMSVEEINGYYIPMNNLVKYLLERDCAKDS